MAEKSIGGSRRIESWVYAVLNPLVEAMRRESAQLARGNLSWRAYSQQTDYVRPIQSYIEDAHRPILEDFLIENIAYRDRFIEHDRLLRELQKRALNFQRSIVNTKQFQESVRRALVGYESKPDPLKPDLQSMLKDLPKYIAEELINNSEHLPSHYTLSRFWDEFRDEFLGYRQSTSFKEVEQATQSLQQVCDKLGSALANLRLKLCRKYDIPAAPFEQAKEAQQPAGATWR